MGLSRDLSANELAGVTTGPVDVVRVRQLPDGRLSRKDAAAYVGVVPKTMAQWAMQGRGPEFVKIAGRVFYYRSALDRFIRGE